MIALLAAALSANLLSAKLLSAQLGELPPQRAEPARCQTFLWTRGDAPLRVGVALDRPDQLRLHWNGQPRDLPLLERGSPAGPPARARYGDAALTVTLDLDFAQRPGVNGLVAEAGAMRLEAPGQDAEVLPVGAVAACPG